MRSSDLQGDYTSDLVEGLDQLTNHNILEFRLDLLWRIKPLVNQHPTPQNRWDSHLEARNYTDIGKHLRPVCGAIQEKGEVLVWLISIHNNNHWSKN